MNMEKTGAGIANVQPTITIGTSLMRCVSCNNLLSDREASRKGIFSGEYLDLCDGCIRTIPDLEYEENPFASNKVVSVEPEIVVDEEENDDY